MNAAAAAAGERADKKGIRRAIGLFVFAVAALTFFSNTLLTLSLPEVDAQQATSGPLSHEVTGSGTIEAAETADLYVETSWPASDVLIKAGDKVEAGQLLVTFKTRDAEDSLQDNRDRYEQKRLSLQKLQESYTESFRSGDDKQLRSIARDIDIARLDMQILERQIATLQRQLGEFARMTAPVAGYVTELNAAKGAAVPNGKAAVKIADLSKGQQLKATVSSAKAQYVAVGDATELIVASLNNARIKATVTDIRDAAAAGSSASVPTSQEKKELTFSLMDPRLKGGEAADFDIVKKTAAFRSLLPNDAVREDDAGKYVLLLKEKKGPLGTEYVLQRAAVQVGDADDSKTAIENGVTPLDKVVVSGSKPVKDGDRVFKNK